MELVAVPTREFVTQWYCRRFAGGTSRMMSVSIRLGTTFSDQWVSPHRLRRGSLTSAQIPTTVNPEGSISLFLAARTAQR